MPVTGCGGVSSSAFQGGGGGPGARCRCARRARVRRLHRAPGAPWDIWLCRCTLGRHCALEPVTLCRRGFQLLLSRSVCQHRATIHPGVEPSPMPCVQGREHEWLFASEEGQRQLAAGCASRRVIIVSLARGQQCGDLAALQVGSAPPSAIAFANFCTAFTASCDASHSHWLLTPLLDLRSCTHTASSSMPLLAKWVTHSRHCLLGQAYLLPLELLLTLAAI